MLTAPVSILVAAIRNPHVQSHRERISQLYAAIGRPEYLSLTQALQWFAVAVEFRPDVIIELGRGISTAILTEAAHLIGATVKSFDLERGWAYQPRIRKLVSDKWLERLEIISADVTRTDFAPHAQGQRTIVVWDCHGYAIADAILGGLIPLIADKQHLVICHDISDNRIVGNRSYAAPFWRGMVDYYDNRPRDVLNLGWARSYMDQLIPILDFCWRNDLELHSADFELKNAGLLETPGEWVYFTMNETALRNFPKRAIHKSHHLRVLARSIRHTARKLLTLLP